MTCDAFSFSSLINPKGISCLEKSRQRAGGRVFARPCKHELTLIYLQVQSPGVRKRKRLPFIKNITEISGEFKAEGNVAAVSHIVAKLYFL